MSDRSQPEESGALRPPQFSLLGLMVLMAVLGLMFALMNRLGPYATLWMVVFVLAGFAHIAGNSLGTRLRAAGGPRRDLPGDGRHEVQTRDVKYAPTTRLGTRYSLGVGIVVCTVLGSVLAGAGGAYWLRHEVRDPHLGNMIVAVAAFGALGGIWTFLSVGFLQVMFAAAWHASRGPKQGD